MSEIGTRFLFFLLPFLLLIPILILQNALGRMIVNFTRRPSGALGTITNKSKESAAQRILYTL